MGPGAQLGRRVPTRSRFSLALPFQLGSKGEGCRPLASDAVASLSPVRIGQERALPALVRGGPCWSQLAEPSWLPVLELAPSVGSKCWLEVLARPREVLAPLGTKCRIRQTWRYARGHRADGANPLP